jgi:Mycothiol maleylpyruvate isomerase N-terminal domain
MADLLHPDDLRNTADLCAETLSAVAGGDWDVPVPGLEWSAGETLFHMARVPLNYAAHLATRAGSPTSFRIGSLIERSDNSPAGPSTVIAAMRAFSWILADVATAAPPQTRAFHQAGMADRSGFLAMACDELIVHTDDIARSFGLSFDPPREPVARAVARLFPWAPADVEPWVALRWANGREGLPPPRGRLGPDWIWHCAPLEEWDGTIPRMSRL